MAASGFLRKLAENNFEENNFVVEFFSEIILSICYSISKNNYFTGFSQFLSFFKHVRDVSRTQSSIKLVLEAYRFLMVLEAYSEQSEDLRWSFLSK